MKRQRGCFFNETPCTLTAGFGHNFAVLRPVMHDVYADIFIIDVSQVHANNQQLGKPGFRTSMHHLLY